MARQLPRLPCPLAVYADSGTCLGILLDCCGALYGRPTTNCPACTAHLQSTRMAAFAWTSCRTSGAPSMMCQPSSPPSRWVLTACCCCATTSPGMAAGGRPILTPIQAGAERASMCIARLPATPAHRRAAAAALAYTRAQNPAADCCWFADVNEPLNIHSLRTTCEPAHLFPAAAVAAVGPQPQLASKLRGAAGCLHFSGAELALRCWRHAAQAAAAELPAAPHHAALPWLASTSA